MGQLIRQARCFRKAFAVHSQIYKKTVAIDQLYD